MTDITRPRHFQTIELRRAARKLVRHQTDFRLRRTGGDPIGDARRVFDSHGVAAPWGSK